MNVKISKSDLNNAMDMLAGIKNGAEKALVKGINATSKTMAVQARVRIANEINLPSKRIGESIKVKKANFQNMSGSLKVSGIPVGLVNFAVSGVRNFEGVTVRVKKGGKRSMIPHTFIARGRRPDDKTKPGSSKTHMWWRKKGSNGKLVGRMPIERLTGPRISDIAADPKVLTPLQTQAAHLLPINVAKQVAEVLRRAK